MVNLHKYWNQGWDIQEQQGTVLLWAPCRISMRWFFWWCWMWSFIPQHSAKSVAEVSKGEKVTPFLLLLSGPLRRYSPFLVPILSFPTETVTRAFVNADFRCIPPPPPCTEHPDLSLPYEGLGGRALGSQGAQGLCSVTVRTIYSASIEKKEWVRPEKYHDIHIKIMSLS